MYEKVKHCVLELLPVYRSAQLSDNVLSHLHASSVDDKWLLWVAGRDGLDQLVWPSRALWTLDISTYSWQQRHASGDLPSPERACALTVVQGHAYLLAGDEQDGMDVFQLDLQTWHWTCLPCTGTLPMSFCNLSAVVLQVHWHVAAACPALL